MYPEREYNDYVCISSRDRPFLLQLRAFLKWKLNWRMGETDSFNEQVQLLTRWVPTQFLSSINLYYKICIKLILIRIKIYYNIKLIYLKLMYF